MSPKLGLSCVGIMSGSSTKDIPMAMVELNRKKRGEAPCMTDDSQILPAKGARYFLN